MALDALLSMIAEHPIAEGAKMTKQVKIQDL
jgi:hypothetical protein